MIAHVRDKFPHLTLFVGGDFNAQMGELDFVNELTSNPHFFVSRRSLDKNVNLRERKITEILSNNNLTILKGKLPGDFRVN